MNTPPSSETRTGADKPEAAGDRFPGLTFCSIAFREESLEEIIPRLAAIGYDGVEVFFQHTEARDDAGANVRRQSPHTLRGDRRPLHLSSGAVGPPAIGLDGHPRLYMSRKEIVAWREELKTTERGPAALQAVLDVAGQNGMKNGRMMPGATDRRGDCWR